MRFDRESWRKLYVIESAEHRLMGLFARTLRDHLLRYAEADGTLLRSSTQNVADMCRVLGAQGKEKAMVAAGMAELLRVGFLSQEGGRLFITRFEEAQTAQSPGAKRQAKYMANKKTRDDDDDGGGSVSSDAGSDVSNDVTPDETRRDETRPDETRRDLGGAGAPPTKRPPRRALRKAPEDWAPKPEHAAIALEERKDLHREAQKFRDHEFKTPRADFDAAFRNWLRSDYGRSSPPGGNRPVNRAEETQRRLQERVRMLEAEEKLGAAQ